MGYSLNTLQRPVFRTNLLLSQKVSSEYTALLVSCEGQGGFTELVLSGLY